MDKLLEALGPWPLLQGMALGIIIAGVGIWALKRGFQDRDEPKHGPSESDIDELQARWQQRQQMQLITETLAQILDVLRDTRQVQIGIQTAMNRLGDMTHNNKQ